MLLPQLLNAVELTVKVNATITSEIGAMGAAIGRKGRVTWTVNPFLIGGTSAIANAHLKPMLFHELNHVVRKQGQSKTALLQRTLLDLIVSEGLATTFERDEGGGNPLWGEYPPQVCDWVREVIGLSAIASHRHWMFRHPDGRRWIGYKVGTYLIDQAVIKMGISSSSELVEAPTDQIFELAGFKI